MIIYFEWWKQLKHVKMVLFLNEMWNQILIFHLLVDTVGLPRWASGKKHTCQCRRHKRCGFDPWIRKIPWRRAWQPTPVFLPRGCHGQRSLAGCSPWGCTESETTEMTLASTHVVNWRLSLGRKYSWWAGWRVTADLEGRQVSTRHLCSIQLVALHLMV